jgi:transposase-like protein
LGVDNVPMRKGQTFLTPKRREVFLQMLGAGLTVDKAARAIGVSRDTVYGWRRSDECFRRDWEAAIDISTDAVEAGLLEAAKNGDVTASIFLLRSRKPEIYNRGLAIRHQMLQLALDKQRAEMAQPPLLEGRAMQVDGIRTSHITTIAMPWNGRDRSPHCPSFDPYGDHEGDPEIVPIEQDGSGLAMDLPDSVMCIHHSEPHEHLPASLTADGQPVPPAAATDLWRRILAFNRLFHEAYPALSPKQRAGYADPIEAPASDDDSSGGDPPDEPDWTGGFGRP